MSSTQLGRVGRGALPLLQQLYRGACQCHRSLSTAADAAGAGAFSEGVAPADSSSGAPPSATREDATRQTQGQQRSMGDRWQPPQAGHDAAATTSSGSDHAGSLRQPGAMSALLDSTQRRGRGQGRPGQRRAGQGDGDEGGGSVNTAVQGGGNVPPHLLDTPHNLLTNFTYALRSAADPSAPAVPLGEVLGDIANFANTDNLRLLRYYVSRGEWQQFLSGDMDVEEQNELADRLAAVLLNDERRTASKAAVQAAIDADPDYDLMASLGSVPQLRGSRRGPPPPSKEDLAAELEQLRGQALASGMTDEDFDAAKADAIPRIRAEWAAAVAPVLPDHLARAARLQKMLDRALPRDHPNYRSAQEKIAVLQANPHWPHERKVVFVRRLLKRLALPQNIAR